MEELGRAQLFLTSIPDVSGQLYALATLPAIIESPVPTVLELGWEHEPVWTVWSRGKSISPTGNRFPASSLYSSRYTD
jgi:hypothetical protein